ncbi:hypothetical protein [Streptomyces caniscabiei]|uniref:hypothetical protein n=1 Tax=Streptomyces caniscabiei TaxID=2746961 RepID=UPI00117E811C|nr:hypothetical protein [Streptomyces caniscabiei]
MASKERGRGAVLFLKTVPGVGGEASAVVQGILQLSEVGGEDWVVGGGEGGVAAGLGLAVGKDRLDGGIGGRAAQGAVGIVDAGDEGPWVHVRVMAGHDAAQAGAVGDDLAVEDRVAGELGESALGFRAGRSGQCRTVTVGAHLGEELAAGEGFLGFDLVAEPGVAGASWWSRVSELPACLRS